MRCLVCLTWFLNRARLRGRYQARNAARQQMGRQALAAGARGKASAPEWPAS